MTLSRDQWPEEEAGFTAIAYKEYLRLDGKEYADKWIERQRAHMHKVFDNDADCARYDAQLDSFLRPIWE